MCPELLILAILGGPLAVLVILVEAGRRRDRRYACPRMPAGTDMQPNARARSNPPQGKKSGHPRNDPGPGADNPDMGKRDDKRDTLDEWRLIRALLRLDDRLKWVRLEPRNRRRN